MMLEGTIHSQLRMMAPTLDNLEEQINAEILFCKISDAVFWTDEVPGSKSDWPTKFSHVMRFLFRYRTSVILDEPDERLQEIYVRSKTLFPNWPGFFPKREAASEEIVNFIVMKRGVFRS